MRALGEQSHRVEQLLDFRARVGVAEDRQPKGRLGDEHVARHAFERGAGRVGAALVIARDHHPAAARLDDDLGRAEHVPGRHEAHRRVAEAHGLAQPGRLRRAGEIGAVAHRHDGERLGGRHDGAVAGAGMVGMTVRDEGARHRPQRVEMEIAERAIQPLRRLGEDVRAGEGHAPII